MVQEILIILACVPLFVVNAFCDKFISSRQGGNNNYVYNVIKFLISSLCVFPILFLDRSPIFEWGCLLCGFTCGLMYAISKTVMLKGYEKTSVAFMTFCHASGMILPCILGHFIWAENLTIYAIIGIFLAILSIVLLKDGESTKKKFDKTGVIYGCIIFMTSGGIMIVQKLMGIYFFDQSVTAYNFYSFIVAFFVLWIFSAKQKNVGFDKKYLFLCATGSAISLSVISLVMTSLSGKVPSVILFPLFNGLGIIFVCIGAAFVFKQKMTEKQLMGLLIGVFGLCLINF